LVVEEAGRLRVRIGERFEASRRQALEAMMGFWAAEVL
jgi:hypothetical protein